MFMIEYKNMGWWYWLVTAILLSYGVAVDTMGFVLAMGLTMFQLVHYLIRERTIRAFPIQVRFWYMILLLASFPEPVQWIYWIPTIGTWAQVIFGYCAMARLVSLLPWSRSEPFSLALVMKTIFRSRPLASL